MIVGQGRFFELFFDIDDALSSSVTIGEQDLLYAHRQQMVITPLRTTYLFHGVCEMMRLVFSQPDLKVRFFSSAPEERNILFVEQLLTKSLGVEWYNRIKGDVVILSGGHMKPGTDWRILEAKFGIFTNKETQRKDLLPYIEGAIEDALLIDDDWSRVEEGQVANMLNIPTHEFGSTTREEGDQLFISHYTCLERLVRERRFVESGHFISVDQTHESDRVGFCHIESGQYKECEIASGASNDEIYELVRQQGGIVEPLYTGLNQICYVVGLLFQELERARATGSALTERMIDLQFKPSSSIGMERKPIAETEKGAKLHFDGKRYLQTVNPQFEFLTAEKYRSVIEAPMTPEETDLVKAMKANLASSADVRMGETVESAALRGAS